MKHQRKEIFTVVGSIENVEGKHRFVPSSPRYFQHCLNKLPIGKKGQATFYEEVPTRSQGQLAYHFVLMGFLADHTGFTKEEQHEVVMKLKFGVKKVRFRGKEFEVRQSIADVAKMKKSDAVELIHFDLELCRELEIHVPTLEELGYIKG